MERRCLRTKELTHSFTNRSVAAVEVDFLYVVKVGITPVHDAGGMVQGEAIGPQHVGRDEDLAMRSIHPGLLYSSSAVN